MGLWNDEDCDCAAESGVLRYFSPRTSSILLAGGGGTGVLSVVVTVPSDVAYAVIVRATAIIAVAGGASGASLAISDSVHGVLGGTGGDGATATSLTLVTTAYRNPISAGQHTITLTGTDTSGAGTATVTKGELEVVLVPAANVTVAASI